MRLLHAASARASLALSLVSVDTNGGEGQQVRRSGTAWKWGHALAVAVAAATLVAPAGASTPARAAHVAGDPSTDKLAQILARGTLILSTDPAYPPQSYRVKGVVRLAHTKCAANQLTGNQMAGYDVDTSKLVAQGLGVEPCFVTPTWSEQISGHWGDRWDIAFASMGITRERMTRLYFTQPYSAEAERFFVRKSSSVKSVQQLSGKRLGGCTGCFAQNYIQRNLDLPGEQVRFLVDRATFVGYDVERNGLADVARGKLDAFLCGVAVGGKAIAEGLALKPVGSDQYVAYLSGAVDRSSGLSAAAFIARVNTIVRRLQAQGVLRRASLKYFHTDFASMADHFDVSRLQQRIA
jgi:ABC-type amino acid transport substrate-binding protein